MNNRIDFSQVCSVFMLGSIKGSDSLCKMHFERSKNLDDDTLTSEAHLKFFKIKFSYPNVDELAGIYIARSQDQYDYITTLEKL